MAGRGRVTTFNIWNEQAVTQNASLESIAKQINQFGPETLFWGDVTASGGGSITITYKVGNASNGTFYTPNNATACCIGYVSSIRNASRDRYDLSIMGAEWIKFKVKENNASPVDVSLDLIISSYK